MADIAEQAAPDPMPPRESRHGWFFTDEGLAEHDRHIQAKTLADVLAVLRERAETIAGYGDAYRHAADYLSERFASAPEGKR